MLYIVCYDLREPADETTDYSKLIEAINTEYPDNAHIQQSVWDVNTRDGVDAIRSKLGLHLPANGCLFVGSIDYWAGRNLDKTPNAWLEMRAPKH